MSALVRIKEYSESDGARVERASVSFCRTNGIAFPTGFEAVFSIDSWIASAPTSKERAKREKAWMTEFCKALGVEFDLTVQTVWGYVCKIQ